MHKAETFQKHQGDEARHMMSKIEGGAELMF